MDVSQSQTGWFLREPVKDPSSFFVGEKMNDKIIKLLSLADSPNDHEALLAFRSARKMMRSSNLDWNGIITTQSKQTHDHVQADVVKLMKIKLQLQQECYAIQDEIATHEKYLAGLKKKVSVAEGENEGYSATKHTPEAYDVDDAFKKIFNALESFGGKKNEFLESLRDQWKEKKWLSPKQISCLRENFVRYMGFEPAW